MISFWLHFVYLSDHNAVARWQAPTQRLFCCSAARKVNTGILSMDTYNKQYLKKSGSQHKILRKQNVIHLDSLDMKVI